MSSARIEELRKKFDENPRRYFAPLANEYRKAGDFDQAIFICQEYLPQQPGHMSGHIVFGQALFEAKRLPEAKTVFETALSLDPENLIALRHLADISRDLGDAVAARAWYERVLQADPRNEEIADIMSKLGSAGAASASTAAVAPTAETPAKTPVGTQPAAAAVPRSTPTPAAPTVQLSAAQVQEMLRARVGSRISAVDSPTEPAEPVQPAAPAPEPELITLDTVSTVEIHAAEPAPMEGLEPTSQAATLDIPTIEPLGLETNAAPGLHMAEAPEAPAPLDGLDTIPLDISLPGSSPVAATMEIPAVPSAPAASQPDAPASDDGLLDLGSFSLGGESASASPEPSPAETPIDGGHGDGLELLDLDLPGAPATPPPAAPEPSVPTMIMDVVKSVVPAVREAVESTVPMVMDAMESAAPAVIDLVDNAIPSVVEAVQSAVQPVVQAAAETPTVIMEAIKAPSAPETPAEPRTSQSVPFVTETMAQLYLSQGHRSEAIDIYRKLIEARPGDAELRARLAAIEGEDRAAAARPEASAPVAATPAARFTGKGPSVRSVLRELFGLDGSATFGGSAASPAVPAEVGSIDMLFSTDSVADSLTPLAVAFDGGHVAARGTIDDLFASGGR